VLIRTLGKHRVLILLLGLSLLAWSFVPGAQRLDNWLYAELAGLMPTAETPVSTVIVTLENEGDSYQTLTDVITHLRSAKVAAVGVTLPLTRSQTRLSTEVNARLHQRLDVKRDAQLLYQRDPDAGLQATLASTPGVVLAVPSTTSASVLRASLAVESSENELAWLLPVLLPTVSQEHLPLINETAPLSIFADAAIVARSSQFDAQLPAILVSAALAAPLENDSKYSPSFELALAASALGVSMNEIKVHPGTGVEFGTAWYATDAGLQIYPRIQSSTQSIARVLASELLAGNVSNKKLQGKTVLIGLADAKKTSTAILPGGARGSGLTWSAQTVNSLLNVSFVSVPHWSLGVQRGALILVLIYLLLLPTALRGRWGLAMGFGLVFLLLNGELLLLILRNTHLPLALPVLFLVLGHGLLYSHRRIGGHFHRLRDERDAALVELASNLRSQGQLDTAFKRLSVRSGSEILHEALYQLGLDFERRRQFSKALAAYDRIARHDDNYRDIRERCARHQQTPEVNLAATTVSYSSTKLVVDDPNVERPVLGRYEIERELGRGAMGTVYLGRDPRISRTVAIKTLALTEEFESEQLEEVRRRFLSGSRNRREAESSKYRHYL